MKKVFCDCCGSDMTEEYPNTSDEYGQWLLYTTSVTLGDPLGGKGKDVELSAQLTCKDNKDLCEACCMEALRRCDTRPQPQPAEHSPRGRIALDVDEVNVVRGAYKVLANIHEQWKGRNTAEGQRVLSGLRDLIAVNSGGDAQTIQDSYSVGGLLS